MKPTPIATPVKAFEAIAPATINHEQEKRYYNSKLKLTAGMI